MADEEVTPINPGSVRVVIPANQLGWTVAYVPLENVSPPEGWELRRQRSTGRG